MTFLDIIGVLVFVTTFLTIMLVLLVRFHRNWLITLILIIFGFTTVYILYATHERILGHATTTPIPENSFLLSYHVEEPDWIYILVFSGSGAPRLHRIEYTRELHEQLNGLELDNGSRFVWQTNERNHGEFVEYDFSHFYNIVK